jgi:urea transporter
MAKMIIAHELPFAFIEYTWFNILMKYNILFFYQRVSRTTIRNDCIQVFEMEKDKIKFFSKVLIGSRSQVIFGLQTKP